MLHCTQIQSNASSWEEFLNFLLNACVSQKESEVKIVEEGVSQ